MGTAHPNVKAILHIVPKEDSSRAQASGVYEPSSLKMEGFMHCSTTEELVRTAGLRALQASFRNTKHFK